MRKERRAIEVKIVDEVAVSKRLQGEQVLQRSPPVSADDDGVVGSSLADRRDEKRLHPAPPVGILKLWLVEHLEKYSIGIGG